MLDEHSTWSSCYSTSGENHFSLNKRLAYEESNELISILKDHVAIIKKIILYPMNLVMLVS